jgi:SAM-dependent methyltransferase
MRLDIGCGRTWPEGWEGLDSVHFGQKYLCDLETVGLNGVKLGGRNVVTIVENGKANPFETVDEIADDSVEAIRMHNTIEHLTRPAALRVLNECWRVLIPGGTMEIVTPNASKSLDLALQDPTHVSMWIPGTFTQYICGGRPRNADYGILKWKMIDIHDYVEGGEPRDMYILMTPRK